MKFAAEEALTESEEVNKSLQRLLRCQTSSAAAKSYAAAMPETVALNQPVA